MDSRVRHVYGLRLDAVCMHLGSCRALLVVTRLGFVYPHSLNTVNVDLLNDVLYCVLAASASRNVRRERLGSCVNLKRFPIEAWCSPAAEGYQC